MLSDELTRAGHRPRGPEREARVRASARARRSPRRAGSARSRSRPTWPAAASTSSSAATPSSSRAPSCASSASSRTTRATRQELARADAPLQGAVRGRGRRGPRARRALHLRHRAPRVAADRQPAPRPLGPPGRPRRVALLPLGRGRPRSGSSPATGSTRSSTGSAPSTTTARSTRSRRRCSRSTIENAQKKVEQQNYLIRKRVLEYDDVMNEQRRVVYKYRREILEGRDMSDVAQRGDRARSSRAWSRSTRRARSSRTGTSAGSRRQAGQLWPLRRPRSPRSTRPDGRPRGDHEAADRGRASPPTSGARRSSATS